MAGKKPEMRIRLLPVCFLLLVFSCTTQEVCDDSGQSELVARFKTLEEDVISDTIISGVTMYGIREGKPDSLLYDSITVSKISLPLDSHHDFSRFILKINEQTDTLGIIHTSEFYMISYTCGFATLFFVHEVSYDSNLMIKDHLITNSAVDAESELDEEHLWIYF